MDLEPDNQGNDFQKYLAILTQISPFSLRGGTREILRGIVQGLV